MEKIILGKVVSTSGIKGFIKVLSYTNSVQDLGMFKNYFTEEGDLLELVKLVSVKKSVATLALKGINSLELAQTLVGKNLCISSDDLPELEEGEIYYKDLIGLPLFFEEELAGTIVNICNYGASDLIEFEKERGGDTALYPFTEDLIIALEKERVVVKKLELV